MSVLCNCCRLAEGTRKAVEGWGLKLLCKESRWNSNSLTVIETPEVLPLSASDSSLTPLRNVAALWPHAQPLQLPESQQAHITPVEDLLLWM